MKFKGKNLFVRKTRKMRYIGQPAEEDDEINIPRIPSNISQGGGFYYDLKPLDDNCNQTSDIDENAFIKYQNGMLKVNEKAYELTFAKDKESPPNIVTNSSNKLNMPRICLINSRYNIIARVVKALNWRIVGELDGWDVYWGDGIQGIDIYKDMKRFQKINHFPGMHEICRKDLLARNLNRMLKMFPNEYNIFPKTWCFPADLGDAIAFSKLYKNKTFIIKPDQGAQGRGIWLTKSLKEIKPSERMICQVYISRPLLIDGYKFDLRVYVLLTSVDPLRIFVYNEGLARFATSKYKEPTSENLLDVFMHLTNYSVNKHSQTFCYDDEAGSKRKFSTLNRILDEEGFDVRGLWKNIDDIIIKTILSAWPMMKHNYHACFPAHDTSQACFEILGFDILVDSKMKPFLMEVNHSPSFHTDEEIDKDVKEALIKDTLNILNTSATDKRKIIEEDRHRVRTRLLKKIIESAAKRNDDTISDMTKDSFNPSPMAKQIAWEEDHLGGFRRILPDPDDPNKYTPYFILQNQASIYSDTAASKRREEAGKKLRNELLQKSQKDIQIKFKENLNFYKRKKEYVPKITSKKWLPANVSIENEERERIGLISERKFLVESSGLLESIIADFSRYGLLSDSDRTKYRDLLSKLSRPRLEDNEEQKKNFIKVQQHTYHMAGDADNNYLTAVQIPIGKSSIGKMDRKFIEIHRRPIDKFFS